MEPNQNQPPDQTSTEAENDAYKIGKIMFFLALLLALLTVYFSKQQARINNPNQNPHSAINAAGERTVILERNRFGHYVSSGTINGESVTFLLDTGATDVAIPQSLEKKLQLKRGRSIYINTANGTSNAYTTQLDSLSIGAIQLRNIDATIAPNMKGDEVLLGMSVLKQLDFAQRGNQLELRR